MFRVSRKDPQAQQASSETQEQKRKELFGFRRGVSEFVDRVTKGKAEQSSQTNPPATLGERSFERISNIEIDYEEIDDFVIIGKLEKKEEPLPEMEGLDEAAVNQWIESQSDLPKEKESEEYDGKLEKSDSEGGVGELDPKLLETMWEFHEDQKLSQVQRIDRVEKKVLNPSASESSKSNGEMRPIKVLSFSRPVRFAPDLTKFLKGEFKGYRFEPGAAAKIAGDVRNRIGEKQFFELVKQGRVSIERVGHRKSSGEDKYYLIIKKPDASGAFSSFQIGYSRKGEKRGVNIEKDYADIAHSPEEIELLQKEREVKTQNLELAKRLTKENAPNVCQMMNYEDGVKVSRLGSMSLDKLDLSQLTKAQRLKLYRSIFEGVFQMHSVGLCHRDLKCENVVVHINENGEAVAWIIDILDFLEEEGENRLGTAIIGTKHMWSQDSVEAYEKEQAQRNQPVKEPVALANPKDDVWAAMLMICQLESKLPEQDRMLSPEFMEMFKTYKENVMDEGFIRRFCSKFREYFEAHPGNLFAADQPPATDYPLDRLVYQMAATQHEARPSAKEVLERFPENLDSFRFNVPVNREAVMELQQLRREFVELSMQGDPRKAEAAERYYAFKKGCGKEFKAAFAAVCEKIVEIGAQEAWQKHAGLRSSSISQSEEDMGNGIDIELQALDHLLSNLYVRFLDEKPPVNATREQVEQLYQLRFEINQLQSKKGNRADIDAKIDAYHALLETLGGPGGDFYKQLDNLGYSLMQKFEQRQRQATQSDIAEGAAFIEQAYTNDFEMQALKAMLEDPFLQFKE
ncbi:MAG: hypothetical protein JSR39_06635 [Verrucomicrobia bacterium]|nr:hypothetical protein [Verrucomicrobiota bacterium]